MNQFVLIFEIIPILSNCYRSNLRFFCGHDWRKNPNSISRSSATSNRWTGLKPLSVSRRWAGDTLNSQPQQLVRTRQSSMRDQGQAAYQMKHLQ